MQRRSNRAFVWKLAAAATGSTFFLQGCDDQTRLAVENGIIDVSTSFVGSFLQAIIQLSAEANALIPF